MTRNADIIKKKGAKKVFFDILENYLLRLMYVHCFSSMQILDEKLTWVFFSLLPPPYRETNVHKKAREK